MNFHRTPANSAGEVEPKLFTPLELFFVAACFAAMVLGGLFTSFLADYLRSPAVRVAKTLSEESTLRHEPVATTVSSGLGAMSLWVSPYLADDEVSFFASRQGLVVASDTSRTTAWCVLLPADVVGPQPEEVACASLLTSGEPLTIVEPSSHRVAAEL